MLTPSVRESVMSDNFFTKIFLQASSASCMTAAMSQSFWIFGQFFARQGCFFLFRYIWRFFCFLLQLRLYLEMKFYQELSRCCIRRRDQSSSSRDRPVITFANILKGIPSERHENRRGLFELRSFPFGTLPRIIMQWRAHSTWLPRIIKDLPSPVPALDLLHLVLI